MSRGGRRAGAGRKPLSEVEKLLKIQQVRISVAIKTETKRQLDDFCKKKGYKIQFVVDRAIVEYIKSN